ncbi:hypothetical protein TrLO_g9507 [Triparma laevis f. longispina]|uniref:RRM domain-containing protein n=1 Tax=Triparma laevis f. longispina TaxID=1714387 RepID=A0A9W7F4K1_9STRA|nr:hypothetical protein TrLO_g9507 [Triparma laevis f. longispina]
MMRIIILLSLILATSSFLVPSFSLRIITGLKSTTENGEIPGPEVVGDPTVEEKDPAEFQPPPEGSPYVKCGRCQATFTFSDDQLGKGRGKYLECGVCGHNWYQSRGKLFTLKPGFEFIKFSDLELNRVQNNLKNGRPADFTGRSKLYVGNLSFGVSEDDLITLFSPFGEVGDISIVRDDTGRSRGFAFVTMVEEEGGEKAREGMDGKEVDGRVLQVREPN